MGSVRIDPISNQSPRTRPSARPPHSTPIAPQTRSFETPQPRPRGQGCRSPDPRDADPPSNQGVRRAPRSARPATNKGRGHCVAGAAVPPWGSPIPRGGRPPRLRTPHRRQAEDTYALIRRSTSPDRPSEKTVTPPQRPRGWPKGGRRPLLHPWACPPRPPHRL